MLDFSKFTFNNNNKNKKNKNLNGVLVISYN